MSLAVSFVMLCVALRAHGGESTLVAADSDVKPQHTQAIHGETIRSRQLDNGGEEKAGLTLENANLRVMLLEDHRVRIEANKGGFAVVAKLCPELANGELQSGFSTHKDILGESKSIKLSTKDGSSQEFWLAPDAPFVCTNVSLRNSGAAPLVLKQLTPISCELKTTSSLAGLRLFSSDGLSPVKSKGSYVFMAVVDPQSDAGMVGGWLTHERSSGVVIADASSDSLKYDASAEYGKVTIEPGTTETSETFALGFFDDAHDGLESLATTIARTNQIQLKLPYNGYSTWYHAKATGTSGASDAPHMARLAKFANDSHLTDFGLNFLQIDDQWQVSRRDFTTNKKGEKAPYPQGMKATAEAIKANGMFAGLWLTPFGWDRNNQALKGLFVQKEDGSVYDVKWAGDCLDMSNPKARDFLAGVIRRITHDWGYQLLKIDGLWAGMAVKILYPEPTYRDDQLGDAVFYDKSRTNEQVYRDGLRLVRKAAGKDVFLLGCNIAQNMRTLGGSFGLVDSMRIGPDIKADWKAIVRCAKPAGWLYFLNGRVWWNDPDCIEVRQPLTIDEARAWASFVAISGQLNLVSEYLPDLPKDRLEIYQRTLPNDGHAARPVDLFQREMPRIWHVKYGDGDTRRDVVALFNWTAPTTPPIAQTAGMEEPAQDQRGDAPAEDSSNISIDLKKLGLPADQHFIGFDYWADQFVPEFTGGKQFNVPPGSCRVISIVRVADHPQVIGTSRHITQGGPDLVSANWNASTNELVGRSKLIAGDDYEIRIDPAGKRVKNAADAEVKADGKFVRVLLHPKQTGEVNWSITFDR